MKRLISAGETLALIEQAARQRGDVRPRGLFSARDGEPASAVGLALSLAGIPDHVLRAMDMLRVPLLVPAVADAFTKNARRLLSRAYAAERNGLRGDALISYLRARTGARR